MILYDYDLYGSKNLGLEELRDVVAQILSLSFVLHDSDYMGGEYYASGGVQDERFAVEVNEIEDEDGAYDREAEFPECATLLRVDATVRGDEIRQLLSTVETLTFLRRTSVSM